jgi:hypothetical protein
VKRAYRRLALLFHPDKAVAACKIVPRLVAATGGTVTAGCDVDARLRAEADTVFKCIQEAKEALAGASSCVRCHAALTRESYLFNRGSPMDGAPLRSCHPAFVCAVVQAAGRCERLAGATACLCCSCRHAHSLNRW